MMVEVMKRILVVVALDVGRRAPDADPWTVVVLACTAAVGSSLGLDSADRSSPCLE